jgi:DNA-binding beta-propeller fold protein YncE
MSQHKPALIFTGLALMLALLTPACTSVPQVALTSAPNTNLVWPSAPAQPSVAFVRSISSPKDLAIKKSFLTRVAEFVFGEEQEELVRPMAVIDVASVLYVADPGAGGVHRFDATSGSYKLIRAEGGVRLPSPVGLAVGEGGSVYVADSAAGAVYVIQPLAEYAVRLPLQETLKQPTGIVFDPVAKELFVSDTTAHQIKVFGAKGALVRTIGRRGEKDGEFNFPTMLWLGEPDKLMVTDSLNFRTQILNRQGNFSGKFGRLGDGAGDAPRQKGGAVDKFGHVYLVDSLLHAVQIFDPSGQLLLSIGGLGQADGEFWLPTGVFVGSDNLIYVADTYNRRVQVFRYVGGPT